MRNPAFLAAAVFIATGLVAAPAPAQTWPDKPIRLIVPSPPGGGTDGVSRGLAGKMGELARWQLFVENRPGSGGNLGMDAAAKAAPDGYTLVMGESANLAINPYLYKKLPFDPARDVAPVALVGTVPLVLVVPATRPFGSLAALVAAARQRQLMFASSGNGTVGHLVAASWQKALGVDMLHVPYKGAGPVMTDLVGGHVDLHFASLPAALSLVQGGKLRALAVTSAQRLPALPEVPTLAESGYKGFEYAVFYGLMAPAGTPPEVIARVGSEVNRALTAPDLRAGFAERGIDVRGGSAEQFAAFLAAERGKWARAVRESGATVD